MIKPKLNHSILIVIIMAPLLLKGQADIKQLYNRGQYQKVIQLTDSLPLIDSTRFSSFFYRAMAQSALYRYSDAVESYQKALQYTSDSIPVLFLLAQNYDNAGNRKEAVNLYQMVVKRDSLHVPAKARLAAIYLMQRDYLKAAGLYSSLISHDTTNSFFFARLAFACNQLGLTPAAIEYYNQAIALNPNDAESAVKLLEIYMSVQMMYPLADSVADTLMVLFPNEVDLIKDKACILGTKGDYTGAIVLFQQAVAMGDSSLFTCQNYGNTLFNNANYPEAVYWLRRYANEQPDNIENLHALALACQRDYRYEESIHLFDTIFLNIYNKPAIAQIFTDRAESCRMFGKYLSFRDSTRLLANEMYNESLNNLNQALDLGANPYNINLKIARLYEDEMKDQKMALKYYEKTMACFPVDEKDIYFKDFLEKKIRTLKEELHFKGN